MPSQNHNKTFRIRIYAMFLSILFLTSCGREQSQETINYQNDLTYFTNTIVDLGNRINSIDADSETAVAELLYYCDKMDAAFLSLTEMEVPEKYADAEILAERASDYMTQAVAHYHLAFEGESFDRSALMTANNYYASAINHLNYIGEVLLGKPVHPEDFTAPTE